MQWCDVDWGATVSAGAAVVQAVGSIWAIKAATKNSRDQARTAIELANKQARDARRMAVFERRKAEQERSQQRHEVYAFFADKILPLRRALSDLRKSAEAGPIQFDQTGKPVVVMGVKPLQTAIDECVRSGSALRDLLLVLKDTFAMQPGPTLFILELTKVANSARSIDIGNNVGKYEHYGKAAQNYLGDIEKAFNHL